MTTPNTLLAAARLAIPNIPWVIAKGGVYIEGAVPPLDDCFVYAYSRNSKFDPLTKPADAYALWKALARHQVEIRCSGEKGKIWRVRINREAAIPEIFDSPEEAMLSAVETLEAMK